MLEGPGFLPSMSFIASV
uniref:Uncharacterized protein n=1 Tax=Anguilla anguilla TaxID=7936 RepID=A0A0E9U6J8_ANGAN